MTRAERVLYLSHVGPAEAANSFFLEAMLPGEIVADIWYVLMTMGDPGNANWVSQSWDNNDNSNNNAVQLMMS